MKYTLSIDLAKRPLIVGKLWKIIFITTSALVPTTASLLVGLNNRSAIANPSGQLTSEQNRSLKTLGIKIAVPSYVPPGFTVASVTTAPCPAKAQRTASGVCRFGPTYQILYRNMQRTCFAVDAIGGGLGGADPEFVFPVDTKLLGKTTLGFGKVPGDGKPATAQQFTRPQPRIWNWPAGESPYYAIRTIENRNGCGANLSLTPLEMKRILQSLTWL